MNDTATAFTALAHKDSTMLGLAALVFFLVCFTASGGETPTQPDLDAVYADALLREGAQRRHAKALVDELLRLNHPRALNLLARYNAIRSPLEIRSEPETASARPGGAWPVAPAQERSEMPGGTETPPPTLAEARLAARESLRRQSEAEQSALLRRQEAMAREREQRRLEQARAEEKQRADFLRREERQREQELEQAREQSLRLIRLAEEEERARLEEWERAEREAAATREENERDAALVQAVQRNLPRFEPHAAVLIFRLMDHGVPDGRRLYERHVELRPGVDLERFRRYSESDVALARNGIQKLLDEEADAIGRELRAEEAKFVAGRNAMDMLRQDTNSIKRTDATSNTLWVDPRTWEAMENDMRLLLLWGAATSFMHLHGGATPFASIRSFADNTLLGSMNGPDSIQIE